jgi:hypothetical protein
LKAAGHIQKRNSIPGIGTQVLIATENNEKQTSSVEGRELAIEYSIRVM